MVKIGEFIEIKGVKCLVLDIIDENPFVIALDTKIKTCFDDKSTNYNNSILERIVNDWLKKLDVPTITRTLDLTAMDGSKCYGTLEVKAAPLTFGEWRKYAEIIAPNVKSSFWLATAWIDPKWKEKWSWDSVCIVNMGGTVTGCGFTPSAVMLIVMGDNWYTGEETPMHRASSYIALATKAQPYNISDTLEAVKIVEGGFAVAYNTWSEFNYSGTRTNYIAFR